jgi:RNase adaptor protein for sRNA GlmZ degradation
MSRIDTKNALLQSVGQVKNIVAMLLFLDAKNQSLIIATLDFKATQRRRPLSNVEARFSYKDF